MLIYGAIWCQVIAHQYPIYHPACHGLWLLFHKAKAFEKEPVTQNTEEECKKCNISKFFSPNFLLTAGPSHEQGEGQALCPRQGAAAGLLEARKAPPAPAPLSPTPFLSTVSRAPTFLA